MWLTDISIKRPVFITMVFLALIVMGYRSMTLMAVDQFPKIDIPVVTVITAYPGAGPEEIEALVTKVIEDQVMTVNKLDELVSVSRDGVSSVTARFLLEADIDAATAEVRDKVQLAKPNLPEDALKQEPKVIKVDLGAKPVITMGLTSDTMDIRALKTLTDQMIADRFAKLSGVGNVEVTGGETREILVEVDQNRLIAYSMTISELRQAIKSANLNIPSGNIKHDFKENIIRVLGEFKNIDEIKNLRFTKGTASGIQSFSLTDVATVTDGTADREDFTRINGMDSVGLIIRKQSDANTLKVVETVKKELTKVEKNYRYVRFNISDDQSVYINSSLEEVRTHLLLGGMLAVLVVFLFLHNIMGTFIIALALPTSMMSTFIVLFAANQTLNMMTLMGLALCTGILIDDSIVVLENIHRHLKMGKDPKQAALDGRSEIGLAAIAITMVDVVVYLPITFMQGIVGRFFSSFGLTVAVATLFSLFVSFTLTPMLASRFFKQEKKRRKIKDSWLIFDEETIIKLKQLLPAEKVMSLSSLVNVKFLGEDLFKARLTDLRFTGEEIAMLMDYTKHVEEYVEESEKGKTIGYKFFAHFDAFYSALDNIYRGVLARILNIRWLVVTVSFMALIIAVRLIAPLLGFEFTPNSDQGKVVLKVELPSDANVHDTDRIVKRIEAIVGNRQDFPEVQSVFSRVGSQAGGLSASGNQGPQYADITINIGQKHSRKRSDVQIRQTMLKKLINIPYRITAVVAGGMTGGATDAPVQIQIMGNKYQMDNILDVAGKIRKITETTPGAIDVDTSWKPGQPETRVMPDRLKIASTGFTVASVGDIVRTSVEGNTDVKYREAGEEYDIRIRLQEKYRKQPWQVNNIYIGSKNNIPVFVKNVADLVESPAPNKIDHYNKQRVVTISAQLASDAPLGNVKAAIQSRMNKEIVLPAGITTTFGGQGKRMVESFGYLNDALKLSIILVYMVMCALFESYVNPFIIMFAIPQAMVGGLMGLFITGKTLNIFSMIGIIMLMGLVAKNGILLIDYTNTLRERGMERDDAIKQAGPVRLRPILMTTVAMVFGMIPIATGTGAGSETRAPMAVVVIGGLLLSTLLTLLVIPVLYAQFDDLLNFLRKVKKTITTNRQT